MRNKRSLLVACVAVLVGTALVVLARHAPPFRETSDGALLEIYTLEALKGRLLVGPYSRFGWHHPGPLYFYLQAPWYWLSGLHTAGLQAGALAINLSAVALIAWTAASSASAPAAVAVSAAIAWYVFRAGDMLVSAWNPHVIVLPLLAYIAVAAALAADDPPPAPEVPRRRSRLLWLVVIGSFLVQTHVAMTPIVAVLGAWAIVLNWRALRPLWVPAGCLTLMIWMPPLLEQLTRQPGNMTRLATFFAGGPAGQPVPTAARAWASALTAAGRPDFTVATGGDFMAAAGMIPVAILQLGALVFVAAATRRPNGFARWLAAMCAAATGVAFVAATRIHDQIVDHEVFWMSALGALNVAAIAGGLLELRADVTSWAHRDRWWSRRIPLGLVGLGWAVSALVGLHGMRGVLNRARTIDDHSVDVLTEEIGDYVEAAHLKRPLFHIEHQIWPIAAGALLRIDKAGFAFAVDDRWSTMFGESFGAKGSEDGEATIAGSPLQPVLMTKP